MANKTFTLAPISKEVILHNIEKAGYSIRRLGNETDYSERTIRQYLDRGEMPEKLLHQIDDVLRPKKHLITMNASVSFYISDDELDDLYMDYKETDHDVELNSLSAESLWRLGKDHMFNYGTISRDDIERRVQFREKRRLLNEEAASSSSQKEV